MNRWATIWLKHDQSRSVELQRDGKHYHLLFFRRQEPEERIVTLKKKDLLDIYNSIGKELGL